MIVGWAALVMASALAFGAGCDGDDDDTAPAEIIGSPGATAEMFLEHVAAMLGGEVRATDAAAELLSSDRRAGLSDDVPASLIGLLGLSSSLQVPPQDITLTSDEPDPDGTAVRAVLRYSHCEVRRTLSMILDEGGWRVDGVSETSAPAPVC